ncbi:MAG: hypothetical protein J0H49_10635 [Acidobacteria bacterium]|nr:hypothetical protein [Acidobacteriota bacterium]
MSRILITFAEDGEAPITFEIPAGVAAAIQSHVDSFTSREMVLENYVPTEKVSNQYDFSKARFFLEECSRLIISPIVKRYAHVIPEVALLKSQQAAIDDQLEMAVQAAALVPVQPQE